MIKELYSSEDEVDVQTDELKQANVNRVNIQACNACLHAVPRRRVACQRHCHDDPTQTLVNECNIDCLSRFNRAMCHSMCPTRKNHRRSEQSVTTPSPMETPAALPNTTINLGAATESSTPAPNSTLSRNETKRVEPNNEKACQECTAKVAERRGSCMRECAAFLQAESTCCTSYCHRKHPVECPCFAKRREATTSTNQANSSTSVQTIVTSSQPPHTNATHGNETRHGWKKASSQLTKPPVDPVLSNEKNAATSKKNSVVHPKRCSRCEVPCQSKYYSCDVSCHLLRAKSLCHMGCKAKRKECFEDCCYSERPGDKCKLLWLKSISTCLHNCKLSECFLKCKQTPFTCP